MKYSTVRINLHVGVMIELKTTRNQLLFVLKHSFLTRLLLIDAFNLTIVKCFPLGNHLALNAVRVRLSSLRQVKAIESNFVQLSLPIGVTLRLDGRETKRNLEIRIVLRELKFKMLARRENVEDDMEKIQNSSQHGQERRTQLVIRSVRGETFPFNQPFSKHFPGDQTFHISFCEK